MVVALPYAIIQDMFSEQIGRYQIKSRIGNGGMATVYLAFDPHFDRNVAIKVIPDHALHEAQSHKRFQREAKAIAQLEHPAIVPVYDYGEDNGRPYLVMRYMVGGSLKDWLSEDPLPLTTITTIIDRVANALDMAHEREIIHRDIKPSNILLDNQGNAYLSDFGIVKFSSTITSTTGSALIGTPAYMSPEQIQGDQPLDHRTDIYALGVMLFEMLTGKRPYEADTPAKQLMAHALEPVPDIYQYNAKLPPGTESIINKAMAKDPEQRYASAGDIASELSKLVSGEARPPQVIGRSFSTKNRKPRRSWLILLSSLIILLLLLMVFLSQTILRNTANNVAPLSIDKPEITHTPSPTIPASDTPTIPPTLQSEELIEPSPMPVPVFDVISLKEGSILQTPESNLGLLPTPQSLLDIPFDPGWKISTQCEHNPAQHQTSISVDTSIQNPRRVYILIQAGNGAIDFEGNVIGKITLYFENGQRLVEPLVLGHNIRDWRFNLPEHYVNSTSSYHLQEVWRGKTEDGIDGRIDLLSIEIPEGLQEEILSNFELTDTSSATVNSEDPCIHLIAITAESSK